MTKWMYQVRRFAAKHQLCAIVLLGTLLATSGCKSQQPFVRSETGKGVEAVKLRPGLMVSMAVLVAGKKEIDEPTKRISDGGTILLPLLGEIPVADMNLDELQNKLVERYKEFFVQPQVILDFVPGVDNDGISPWGFVTVLGRVEKPGRIAIPATRDMTVSGAIQKTGGFASSAKANGILVTRSLPGGRSSTRTVNLHAAGAEGRLEEDIVLEADDVVYVPEALF